MPNKSKRGRKCMNLRLAGLVGSFFLVFLLAYLIDRILG
jgi:hypothetical protein